MRQQISREQVFAIESPEFTKTWHPVSHKVVVEAIEHSLKAQGIGICKEIYSFRDKAGKNLFGTWVLDVEKDGKNIQIGFRNSLSKHFAIGICAGVYVFVCSNMCFKGDFIEFRRHTSGVDIEEVRIVASRSITQAIHEGHQAIEWQNGLKTSPLNDTQLKCITYDAMDRGILPPANFRQFTQAHEEEISLSNESTLYEFHGAITRMVRSLNLFTLDSRSRMLNDLCIDYKEAS